MPTKSMLATKSIPTKDAVAFNAAHWPVHNQRQGIDWNESRYALGAFEADVCVGVALYKVVGGMAELEQIVVMDGHTSRGVGSELMTAFEQDVAALGCHVILLETAETQAPAFYEKHGYSRVFTLPDGRFHLAWHLYRKEIG